MAPTPPDKQPTSLGNAADLRVPKPRILAIDGPAGAGKSTIAAAMAARFGLLNLETGAMYRAFAIKALALQLSPDDSAGLTALTLHTTVELRPGGNGNTVLLDGEDVTARLRTAAISDAASRVSVHAPVRAWMVQLQQQLGHAALARGASGVVMEGRDIGTVVFPDASLKIFLSASAEARATRRLEQFAGSSGEAQTDDARSTLAAIRERDERDQNRAASPLRAAPDAITIDSTALSLDDVVERVAALVMGHWELDTKAAQDESTSS